MAFLPWFLACFALLAVGCGPSIGDDCKSSLDCSQQNNRVCDRQQPGGYCTLIGCENNSCPDDAVCVTFRPEPQRLASTWCMATCDDDGDCRDDQGYRCRNAAQLNAVDTCRLPVASVAYKPGAKFCVVPPTAPAADAGVETMCDVDAGM